LFGLSDRFQFYGGAPRNGMKQWTASVVAILLASFPGVASAGWTATGYPSVPHVPTATSVLVASIVDNRTLPLARHACSQTRRVSNR